MTKRERQEAKLRATAYHEAGHALMAYIFKRVITLATIREGKFILDTVPTTSLGHVQRKDKIRRKFSAFIEQSDGSFEAYEPKLKNQSKKVCEAKRDILIYLGGLATEQYEPNMVDEESNLWIHSSCRSDIQGVNRCANSICNSNEDAQQLIFEMRFLAKLLISLQPYTEAIKTLASSLLDQETIKYFEIRNIIRGSIDDLLRQSTTEECRGLLISQHHLLKEFPKTMWEPLYTHKAKDGRPVYYRKKKWIKV